MKYFDVPLDHAWKVPVLQELINTRTSNLYVDGFPWLGNNWNDKYFM